MALKGQRCEETGVFRLERGLQEDVSQIYSKIDVEYLCVPFTRYVKQLTSL